VGYHAGETVNDPKNKKPRRSAKAKQDVEIPPYGLKRESRSARERLQAEIERLERVNVELTAVSSQLAHRMRELMRSEERLRQRQLLSELQHRVRNTLGVVRSIARRTAETSETVDEYAMHLDGRLNALARVQAAVTRDPAAGVSLEALVAEELLGYGAHEGEQVSIAGPPVRLQPKAAESLGMAVHELATNAVKYGALARPDGRIDVNWSFQPDGSDRRLVFEWDEHGAPPSDGPKRRGFGTELLERTLNYELSAETALDFGADGLRCRILLPVSARLLVPGPPA
jgi:two-component system CheB/CheR fusion protein